MAYRILDFQARLAARGFPPGPIDGINGPQTRAAMAAFREERGYAIEHDFHSSGLHRVIMHWTARAEGIIALERRHYHVIIGQDARAYIGDNPPEANADTRGVYTPHTRALNTGSIGVALDGMAGALERPFDPGSAPITWPMVGEMCRQVAALCETYDIPVSRWTVLTHAEVEPTLGVRQRFKWDINWLPGRPRPVDSVEAGDELRLMISKYLDESRYAA